MRLEAIAINFFSGNQVAKLNISIQKVNIPGFLGINVVTSK